MPSVWFTSFTSCFTASRLRPRTSPASMRNTYHSAVATPAGTRARRGERPTTPAKGRTPARRPGRNREKKMAQTP